MEDIGRGDFTTLWTVGEGEQGRGAVVFKEAAVVAGLDVAGRAWRLLDRRVEFKKRVLDGDEIEAGTVAARLEGNTRALLTAERTALNFLQRMSGIASRTRAFVRRVESTGVKILDTRKTAPGLRIFDRYAVRVGGGVNHRWGLWDMVLLKGNHIQAARGPREAYQKVSRRNRRGLPVEIEVRNLGELSEVLGLAIERIMLDNMSIREMKEAVELVKGKLRGTRKPLLEASGNITLENVRAVAETGVDLISVGALTHSVRAIDVSFSLE